MNVMVLKRPVRGVHHLYGESGENSQEQQDHEIALIMGDELDEASRDRELKAHADRIRVLEEELQRARAEAYQAGFDEGQAIAKAEAQKQFAMLTQEFQNNIVSMRNEFGDTFDHLTPRIILMAKILAQKLLNRELTLPDKADEILLTQIHRVLQETLSQTKIDIHVNSSQMDWITGNQILKQLNAVGEGNLRFFPNPSLKPGECKIETEDYLVDSTINAQLDVLETALLESDATNPA